MMSNSKMSFQKELHNIVVDPLSLKEPPFTQTSSETTSPQGITASHESTQPTKNKFLSSIQPSSSNSSPQSPEPPNEVTTMSLSNSTQGRTQAPQVDFDLKLSTPMEHENNMNQLRFLKTESNYIKEIPSNKGIDYGLFRCRALCMCLPGFGKSTKTKQVKALKGENEKDHSNSVHHVIVSSSSTFSFEKFEHDSGVVTQQGFIMNNENHGDESTSSYFELPSQILKCTGDGTPQSPVTPTFILNQDIK